ncbi:hypothetical protein [Limosilactobacillus vaginalis]|uniref:hypothetical protein n=1 Tax=Limosilactobacillus vaginalis TaxID=1633 RepID=UPI0022E534A3|nr:hypothetical protein [Limosilactobacillus vaginalis]
MRSRKLLIGFSSGEHVGIFLSSKVNNSLTFSHGNARQISSRQIFLFSITIPNIGSLVIVIFCQRSIILAIIELFISDE